MKIEALTWQTAPSEPLLLADEVHLWQSWLSFTPEILAQLRDTLSTDEENRLARFKTVEFQNRFIAAHGILRATLAHYLAISPTEIRFSISENGKPSIAHPDTKLQFNLSHTKEMMMCAVSYRQVGVDVERVRALKRQAKFAVRFFSPPENEWLESVPSAKYLDAFFAIWTGKEAYLKACGDGITRPLRGIDIAFPPDAPPSLRAVADRPADTERWDVRLFSPQTGYLGSVAVEGNDDFQLRAFSWE